MKQEEMKVVRQNLMAPKIYELVLEGELVSEMKVPGQFVHCKTKRADLLLRRPISLASIDLEAKQCTLIYRVEGEGTKDMSQLVPGDKLDVLGPLGNGFPVTDISEGELVIVIGGGIGIPPLYEVAKQANIRGAKVISFLGFASKEVLYYEEKFRELGDVYISTDDGSYGVTGHMGILLDKYLPGIKPDAVYSCGALGMLAKVNDYFLDHPRAFISMEERMACGIGACYACVCDVKNTETGTVSTKKVCDEGPVFETGVVQL